MLVHKSTQRVLAQQIEFMMDPRSRSIGLLKYSAAPKNYAAIFQLPFLGIFPLVHTMGMKFAIDLIFCDQDHRVSHQYLNVSRGRWIFPWTHALGGLRYLLEAPAGSFESVKEGDELEWPAP